MQLDQSPYNAIIPPNSKADGERKIAMGVTVEIPEKECLKKYKRADFVVHRQNQPLHDVIRQAVAHYLDNVAKKGQKNIYDLVLAEIEIPVLNTLMEFVRGNQSRAATLLGLSRGTLRKKLKQYGMLD